MGEGEKELQINVIFIRVISNFGIIAISILIQIFCIFRKFFKRNSAF